MLLSTGGNEALKHVKRLHNINKYTSQTGSGYVTDLNTH